MSIYRVPMSRARGVIRQWSNATPALWMTEDLGWNLGLKTHALSSSASEAVKINKTVIWDEIMLLADQFLSESLSDTSLGETT